MLCYCNTSIYRISIMESTSGILKRSFRSFILKIPNIKGKNKTAYFNGFIKKVQKRLFNWNCHFLSIRSKYFLLNHDLQSMLIDLLASVGIPRGLIYRPKRLFFSFFWNNSVDIRYWLWVSWHLICDSTFEGILGLRSLLQEMV